MATGLKSARITPADGEAFFTSAMSVICPKRRIAARKSRVGGRSAIRRSSSVSGSVAFAAAISRHFVSMMRSRMVGIGSTFAVDGAEVS